MKYLILIYSNPESRQIWDGLSEAQRTEALQDYVQLNKDLAESGEIIVSESLADPVTAKRVYRKEGRATTTDGPFAEVKEHLAGFYVVECDNTERAVELAGRIPEAAFGLVEVRPVQRFSGL